MTLSVIVPIYNKEKYLDQAINSLLKQTYDHVEIVLVDNGSTDASRDIAANWAARNSRIRFAVEEQRGVSFARNRGLDIATGSYVGFIDADDVIEVDMYETLMSRVEETGSEIAFCGFSCFDEDPGQAYGAVIPPRSGDGIPIELGDELFALTTPSVCTKVFSVDLIDRVEMQFDSTLSVAEDLLFTYTLMVHASRVAFVDKALYKYRQGVSSSLSSRCGGNRMDVFSSLTRLAAEIDKNENAGLFEKGFQRVVLQNAAWAINGARSSEEFDIIFQEFHNNWRGRINDVDYASWSQYFEAPTSRDLLFLQRNQYLQLVSALSAELEEARAKTMELESSTSYRIGHALTAVPRMMRIRLSKRKRF